MVKKMVLGGGCFWGIQELIRQQDGVISTTVGYAGGSEPNPTYELHTGHAEVVEITYDSDKTTYLNLLDFFFRIHDPTTLDRQGNDVGSSYRSVIFYSNEDEKQEALKMIDVVNSSGRWPSKVVTTLEPLGKYTPAEEYHQDYLQKYPNGYTCHYIRGKSYLS